MTRSAAGVIVYAKSTQSVLLVRRTDSGLWCQPGGHVEPGESSRVAALRELEEETGALADTLTVERVVTLWISEHGEVTLSRQRQPVLVYALYLAMTSHGFEPRLNEEHDASAWCRPSRLPKRLHAGTDLGLRYFFGRT